MTFVDSWHPNFTFNVTDVRMLDTISKLLTKSITIKLPLDQIDDKLIAEMEDVLVCKPGPYTLKFKMVDADEDIGLDMISTEIKVSADYQLIDQL